MSNPNPGADAPNDTPAAGSAGAPQNLSDAASIVYFKEEAKKAFKARDEQKAEADKLKADLEKLKADNAEALTAQTTQFKSKLISSAIDSIVNGLPEGSSRTSIKKLLDVSAVKVSDDFVVDTATITSQIEELKKTDAALFGTVKVPPVAPSGGDIKDPAGYKAELEAAVKAKDYKALENIATKYGVKATPFR